MRDSSSQNNVSWAYSLFSKNMSTKYNHGLDDLVFRDGRLIAIGAIVGSVLIAAGCLGGLFTAFGIDESNWESKVWWRFGFVFLFIFAGFFSIAASILRPMRMLLISGLVSAAFAFVIACFPSGVQLVTGPVTDVGLIQSIVAQRQSTRYRVRPFSGAVVTQRVPSIAIVTLILDNGEQKAIRLRCDDLQDHFGLEISGLSTPKRGTWKIVYLPYLDRVLTLRQE